MNPVEKIWRAAFVWLVVVAVALLVLSLSRADSARAEPPQQANACFNAPAVADPTNSVCISNVVVSFNGVSPENQFVVSWRTQTAQTGSVKLNNATYQDVRGAEFQGTTHYIKISNLAAKTTYTFDIVSGDETFTQGGAHWSVRLGPAIQPATPYFIFGRVKNPDGSDADGAIVYAQVRDGDDRGTNGRSSLLSGLIVLADGGDFFNINVETARTQNISQKYVYNADADRVYISAVGTQGSASKQFKISDLHPPKPPPSLILSGNGTGSVVTATPTLIPATATPTLSPTLTETITPSPTLTHTALPPTKTSVPPATATPDAPPTFENVPTIAPDQATRLAATPNTTLVAIPAGGQGEPSHTRVFGGVPDIQPPAPQPNNTVLFIGLAVVLFVGAVLLGLAAFFASRRS